MRRAYCATTVFHCFTKSWIGFRVIESPLAEKRDQPVDIVLATDDRNHAHEWPARLRQDCCLAVFANPFQQVGEAPNGIFDR